MRKSSHQLENINKILLKEPNKNSQVRVTEITSNLPLNPFEQAEERIGKLEYTSKCPRIRGCGCTIL